MRSADRQTPRVTRIGGELPSVSHASLRRETVKDMTGKLFDFRYDLSQAQLNAIVSQAAANANTPMQLYASEEMMVTSDSPISVYAVITLSRLLGVDVSLTRGAAIVSNTRALARLNNLDMQDIARPGNEEKWETLAEGTAYTQLLVVEHGKATNLGEHLMPGYKSRPSIYEALLFGPLLVANPLLPEQSLVDYLSHENNFKEQLLSTVGAENELVMLQVHTSGDMDSYEMKESLAAIRALAWCRLLYSEKTWREVNITDEHWGLIRNMVGQFATHENPNYLYILAYYATILGAEEASITEDRKIRIVLSKSEEDTVKKPFPVVMDF